ncbi:hypothetical protein ABZ128_03620 [Streptomyces sp. NPDC006326]|uniref:hypothetical protein n=1 Tax=Streptomyces sp. NPDC006326 TaxID=3156752 RepID=UPI0033BBCC63
MIARESPATALDAAIEHVVGDLNVLYDDHLRGLLPPERAALAAAHRDLVTAEDAVAYHRNALQRLSSGSYPVDPALLDRLRRTVHDLAQATAARDRLQQDAAVALEEAKAASPAPAHADEELTPSDLAALLSLAGGGTMREHLLTHRVYVRTAQGRVVEVQAFQRLEAQGLVTRDASRALTVGQPVTLTDTGRTALLAARRSPAMGHPMPARPAGAWPTSARRH